MQVLNRTAVTIVGADPYVEWTRRRDAAFDTGTLTIARTRSYGSAFLLPEFQLEEDLQEWVEQNHAWLFEFQLAAWTEDEAAWPQQRDLTMFRQWFRVEIHSVVVDAAEEELEGVDL